MELTKIELEMLYHIVGFAFESGFTNDLKHEIYHEICFGIEEKLSEFSNDILLK